MSILDLLHEDAESIYIGNVFTIESDLNLPRYGKNGSSIDWYSSDENIIQRTGKVHRPLAGMGNRTITLIAKLSLNKSIYKKEFLCTVLEENIRSKLIEFLPIKEIIVVGSNEYLPTFAIGRYDDNLYKSVFVNWHRKESLETLQEGNYIFEGKIACISEEAINITANITVESNSPLESKEIMPLKLGKFPLSWVKVNGGIFESNLQQMVSYLLGADLDSLLFCFRKTAQIDTRNAKPMTGWDAPNSLLRGHTTGHFLSALSLAISSNHSESQHLTDILSYLVNGLAECQVALYEKKIARKGFLSAYDEEQFDELEIYTKYPTIWAPYYTLHKLMAGLLDAYQLAGNDNALNIVLDLGLWVFNRLNQTNHEQRQKMWDLYIAGEYGGMNEVMARLYSINKRPEFLEAAMFFDNDKLYYPMKKNINTLPGIHANQHIPQILGCVELYKATKKLEYLKIAKNFWDFVVNNHIYCIGGVGEGEMFREAKSVGKYLTDRTAESCASYNMLKLTSELFTFFPNSNKMDYFERVLINHILSSHDISGSTGGSTYFMPLCPNGQKTFDLSDNSCCHGTGLESHLKYQDSIYFQESSDNDEIKLYVELFIPSTLTWYDYNLQVKQTKDFLQTQDIHLDISILDNSRQLDINRNLSIHVRIPEWFEGIPETGHSIESFYLNKQTNYIMFTDIVPSTHFTVSFPFQLRLESVPDYPELISLFYGPIVLAIEAKLEEEILEVESESNFLELIEFTNVGNHFLFMGRKIKPLYEIQDERYHIYVKTRK